MFLLSRIESVSEWFTTHIYFSLASVFGRLFEHLEFAVFEVTAFLLALALVILLVFSLYYFVHKNKENGFSLLTTFALIISLFVFSYVSIASTMYNRKPLDVEEVECVLSKEEVESIATAYFADFNNVAAMQTVDEDGLSVCPYTEKELIQKIKEEYAKLDSPYFAKYTASPKPIASSYLMTAFAISGISYVPTFEPGYNYMLYFPEKTLTIAHEMAHTKGIMREADANELAYYVLLNSEDNYLKYIGYLYSYTYVRSALALSNSEIEISVPSVAIKDRVQGIEFWSEKAVLRNLGKAINEWYLKSNSQSGTDSYQSKDTHEEETIIDDQGNEQTIYHVINFSHVQNMIFALYQN